jgi:four helix bundle protein
MTLAPGEPMSRDHTKLRFFTLADQLVLDVYRLTQLLPDSQRYGLQSQLRRAAVSAVVNIVEGCSRRSDRAYVQFLETSLGSATETRYLLDLATRLHLLPSDQAGPLKARYTDVIKATQKLITTIAESRPLIADS